jgi:hypothetical protein
VYIGFYFAGSYIDFVTNNSPSYNSTNGCFDGNCSKKTTCFQPFYKNCVESGALFTGFLGTFVNFIIIMCVSMCFEAEQPKQSDDHELKTMDNNNEVNKQNIKTIVNPIVEPEKIKDITCPLSLSSSSNTIIIDSSIGNTSVSC